MAEDDAFVQNEVGFPGRGYHFGSMPLPPATGPAALSLVGAWKGLGFLDLHLDVAALEGASAGLVAEHLGAALFAHVTLTEHVSHLNPLLESGPCGPR